MIRLGTLVTLTFVTTLLGAARSADDWPGWRGPHGDGQARPGQSVPTSWSETENVVWRTALPGRGHGSPTIVGNRIFLPTADDAAQEQRVLALDRSSGKIVWDTVVHRGKFNQQDPKSSHASSTPACDGERVYINFYNDGAIHTTALDLAGKILWQQRVSDFVTVRGFGSSPVAHESAVLVTADHKQGGRIAGLDKLTGQILWQHERPALQNYSSPALLRIGGRLQMIVAGCNLVASFDPASGKKNWEVAGSTETTVTTPVTDGVRVFITGGFPRSHTAAIAGDGSGALAWQSTTGIYVPSLLVRAGHVYGVVDSGRVVCWQADTGEELWRDKIDRDFLSSPVMLGDRVFASSLAGVTSVFEATPRKFTLLAQSKLGDEAVASPAIAGNRIYLRHAKKGESRQEFLWCIGNR